MYTRIRVLPRYGEDENSFIRTIKTKKGNKDKERRHERKG